MDSKRVISIKDEIDVDWQLIATELDTSLHLMRYLHKEDDWDSLRLDQFDALVNNIENEDGVECYSYNDYMVLYEYMNEPVIVFTIANDKYVIFDVNNAKQIERQMNSYCLN